MAQHKNFSLIKLSLIIPFFLTFSLGQAQTCDEGIASAQYQYSVGEYGNVINSLTPCINSFNNYDNSEYYQNEGRSRVFQVYKLICSSYYELGDEYEEEDKENELIYYFNGIYSPGEVLDILDNTPL